MVMEIVYVEWFDAASYEGWMPKEEAMDLEHVVCKNVGILVKQNDSITVLAAGLSPDRYGDIWTIPTICITKQETLREI